MFKSLLTVTAVLVMAAPAMASKARMASLQNAAQLVDTQSLFENPAKAYLLGDFAVLEMGAKSTYRVGVNTPENIVTNGGTAGIGAFYSPNAEGGFVRSYGDNKVGFYLGRKSAFTSRVRTVLGYAGQENPFEIMYGFQAMDLKWGASFNYSASEPKVAAGQQKQDAMGLRLGVIASNWDAALTLGLGSKATGNAASAFGLTAASATSDYKGTTGFKLSGGYWMEQMYVFANLYQDGVELSGMTGAGSFAGVTAAKIEQSQYEIGVIDTIKADGMNFFYGASYIGFKSDDKNDNAAVDAAFNMEQTSLPFVIGVEADAASWLTLRASAKQNVILGSSKVNTADSTTVANNTTVALGAGLKLNKFTLDSTLLAGSVPSTAGNGNIDTTNLMANASLTYMF
jgi:hypothetical protein